MPRQSENTRGGDDARRAEALSYLEGDRGSATDDEFRQAVARMDADLRTLRDMPAIFVVGDARRRLARMVSDRMREEDREQQRLRSWRRDIVEQVPVRFAAETQILRLRATRLSSEERRTFEQGLRAESRRTADRMERWASAQPLIVSEAEILDSALADSVARLATLLADLK